MSTPGIRRRPIAVESRTPTRWPAPGASVEVEHHEIQEVLLGLEERILHGLVGVALEEQ